MKISLLLRRCAPGVLALPALASAHTGDGALHAHAPFLAGLLHPLGGADHLAAMFAVGAWSALALQRKWFAPAAFVAVFAAGAIAGMAGFAGTIIGPMVEPMIAASLLVLGLLVATRQGLPLALALGLSGFFAFFHGAAHGRELAAFDLADSAAALAGMLLATAALHGAGILAGTRALATRHRLSAAVGAGVALLGSALLLGLA